MTFDEEHTLAAAAQELRDQWDLIRGRLDECDADVLSAAAALPGWTVTDLLASIGRTLDAVAAAELVEAAEPIDLDEYLAARAPSTEQDAPTRAYATAHGADLRAALNTSAEAAFAQLGALVAAGPEAAVRTDGTDVNLGDFIAASLIELVLRGYDLAPSITAPTPVDSGARELAANALIEVANQRGGYALTVADAATWIKAASGRGTWAQVVSGSAVRPQYLSDGVPDLGPLLPLV